MYLLLCDFYRNITEEYRARVALLLRLVRVDIIMHMSLPCLATSVLLHLHHRGLVDKLGCLSFAVRGTTLLHCVPRRAPSDLLSRTDIALVSLFWSSLILFIVALCRKSLGFGLLLWGFIALLFLDLLGM